MATTRFGIDGGIAPSLGAIEGPQSQTIGLATEADSAFAVVDGSILLASIGLATESDSAQPIAGFSTENIVTRMGLDGGIGNNARSFATKVQFLAQATETDTAFAVIDPNDVILTAGLATESDSAFTMAAFGPLTVTLVSSIRGTNIITANSQLTVNVTNSTNVTIITVNGVNATGITIVTPTEITCNIPLGIGQPYFSNPDIIVDNGAPSLPFTAGEWQPPLGMVETDFNEAYAGLDPDSPFAGDPTFIDLAVGDSCIYDALTTPDSLGVSMDGAGEFTITGTITQIQQFNYYIYDLSDNTVSASIEQITVQPGPVEAPIGQSSEADSAFTVTSNVATIGVIVAATEVDSAFAVVDGSIFTGAIGLATEVDSAFTVAGGPQQVIAIGQTSEVDSAFAVIDSSIPTRLINQVSEGDFAFPVTAAGTVFYQITRASEIDSALAVNFPADLDSIRDQIEALETIILAQQQQIFDLYTRFDLDTAAPNTYRIDGATIVNNEFTLTKTDNLDGTFTIEKT